jgi:hypothetical protein
MEVDQNVNRSFDFLEEVQKGHNYKALFPEEKAVRAILWLYAKMADGAFPGEKFKEEDINNAFQESNPEGRYSRLPQEYIHGLTGSLLEYFFLYNEQERVYIFRDYGKSFCKLAEDTLAGNFNPTNIEIICRDLLLELRKIDNREMLSSWLGIKFDAFEPKMSSQVDFLDRKIDMAVSVIRDSAQLQTGEILETLKKVDTHLEQLRGYNKELRSAFAALKDINSELEQRIILADNRQILDRFSHVQQFFPDIRYRLDLIDKRLDKLQPRLRQFFGALNKPLFNTRVESFLRYLLKASTVQADGSKKNIQFPQGIPPLRIYQHTSRFIIVERKDDLFPTMARPKPVYEESEDRRRAIMEMLNKKIRQQDKIEEWTHRILDDCLKQKAITYSGYFITMLDQQQGDIDLAVRVTHRLIKISTIGKEIKLEVDPNTEVQHQNIRLWETKIISR